MKEVGEDEDWSLFWTDYSVALERCMDMKRYQVGYKLYDVVTAWQAYDQLLHTIYLSVVFDDFDLVFISFQKINHFPGMIEICRKDLLARNMNRLLKLYPKEYQVFPKTWVLPAE